MEKYFKKYIIISFQIFVLFYINQIIDCRAHVIIIDFFINLAINDSLNNYRFYLNSSNNSRIKQLDQQQQLYSNSSYILNFTACCGETLGVSLREYKQRGPIYYSTLYTERRALYDPTSAAISTLENVCQIFYCLYVKLIITKQLPVTETFIRKCVYIILRSYFETNEQVTFSQKNLKSTK